MQHDMVLSSRDVEAGIMVIEGRCSCSAWFDIIADGATRLFSTAFNGFPVRCPVTQPLHDHIAKEMQ